MKIIFFGDSGTDSNRQRGCDDAGRVPEEYSNEPRALGSGYVFLTATQLYYEKPAYYQVLNRGILFTGQVVPAHPNIQNVRLFAPNVQVDTRVQLR